MKANFDLKKKKKSREGKICPTKYLNQSKQQVLSKLLCMIPPETLLM